MIKNTRTLKAVLLSPVPTFFIGILIGVVFFMTIAKNDNSGASLLIKLLMFGITLMLISYIVIIIIGIPMHIIYQRKNIRLLYAYIIPPTLIITLAVYFRLISQCSEELCFYQSEYLWFVLPALFVPPIMFGVFWYLVSKPK
ncbi:hypothetical protein [Marinicella gelatinilytica]|uniref:hypothetical protein n=1 Tax=Marinicella gelatinilytica TaxID=2996017 RepID=UPI002260FF73|nr:hypothetical protein [Marinicella gelatinilytica]MCX7544405.1 hypothetical protein [Marinicella gelatinilytica]